MPRPLKITLWIVGGLFGFFVVVGIIGAITMEPEDPEVAPATTTTTTTAPPTTTTEAPTEADVSAALQEIFADWTEQDCADEAVWYHDFYTPQESAKRTAMREDIEAGRFMEAEWDYWELWGMTTTALDDYALWMEICAAKSSPALVAEVEAFPLIVEEARNDLVTECYEIQAQLIAEDRLVDSSGGLLVWSDCIPPDLNG